MVVQGDQVYPPVGLGHEAKRCWVVRPFSPVGQARFWVSTLGVGSVHGAGLLGPGKAYWVPGAPAPGAKGGGVPPPPTVSGAEDTGPPAVNTGGVKVG